MNKIELDFEAKQKWYQNTRGTKNPTGIVSVVHAMLESKKIWWWSWEFVGKKTSKGYWLSHRAPARASDLAIFYPNIVECRKIGKFAIYRLRIENSRAISEFLKNNT